jgi:hypothetical protein
MKRQNQRRHKKQVRTGRRTLPHTAEEFFSKSEQSQDHWNRVVHAISKMRIDGISLHQAARTFEIDPRTVLRLGKSALRKRPNGRYAAKASDCLLRVLEVLTPDGRKEIALRDSRQASQVGKHWDAVQRYLQQGDVSALGHFQGVQVTDANGISVPLLADLGEVARLGNAGVLSFQSMYARTA